MTEKIVVRTAKPSDSEAITHVYLASRKAFVGFAPLVHSDESVEQWIREQVIPDMFVTVVEINNVIIGMMVLAKEGNIGWIEHLYLAPSAVGQGIGTILVNEAKKNLGSPIRLCTFQENTKARRFYERHGFQIIELRDGSANEEGCPDAVILFVRCNVC
ncbi:MAG: GNAT family N-acetyltransferase [Legionella sp.]